MSVSIVGDLCEWVPRGATCYLNSLVQMMFMTPELRDGLFRLNPKDLGVQWVRTTATLDGVGCCLDFIAPQKGNMPAPPDPSPPSSCVFLQLEEEEEEREREKEAASAPVVLGEGLAVDPRVVEQLVNMGFSQFGTAILSST